MRWTAITLATLAALLGVLARYAPADDLRIETNVFTGKSKTSVSHSTTLFHAGVVYDYLNDPPQVAVFQKTHGGRFVLLDPVRKVRTEIPTSEVLTVCGELRAMAINHSNGFHQFCGQPRFAVEFSDGSSELLLSSEFMTYKLQTMRTETPEAANQVREFSDWYARLNAMTNIGGPPPFARLEVNEELDKRGLVATQVELSIPAQVQLGGKSMTIRSEHTIAWRLVRSDLDRISETHVQLVNFTLVPFAKFNSPAEVTKK